MISAATQGDRTAVASFFPFFPAMQRLLELDTASDALGPVGELQATRKSSTERETKKLLDAVRDQDLHGIELEDLGTTAMIESEKPHRLKGHDWGEVRVSEGKGIGGCSDPRQVRGPTSASCPGPCAPRFRPAPPPPDADPGPESTCRTLIAPACPTNPTKLPHRGRLARSFHGVGGQRVRGRSFLSRRGRRTRLEGTPDLLLAPVQDPVLDHRVRDHCDDLQFISTARTDHRIHLVDAAQQARPRTTALLDAGEFVIFVRCLRAGAEITSQFQVLGERT